MSTHRSGTTLWGGRFSTPVDEQMRAFNESFPFDQRLYASDVAGSIAYCVALQAAGLLTSQEAAQLTTGLETIADEFASGTFQPVAEDEDIHTAIERRLHDLCGDVAGKLHTGRSRNDQVATAFRLYLRDAADALLAALRTVQDAILAKAEAHLGAIMPGYTHLQRAQPILFSHWLLSFFWKFERDAARVAASRERTNVCPLGSGALAGNPFDIDRDVLATSLGFGRASENSLDAVEDRDFVAEFLFAAAMVQSHLGSLAETLILWSSETVSFVQLDEKHCTGSSLMPQKRNPDALELVRGKCGRVLGHLVGLLTTLKGLPSGYNKDLQEDKEGLFDVIDTLSIELPIVASIIGSMTPQIETMAAACDASMMATDLADELVRKGVPFRQAHALVGRAVREAEQSGVSLEQLPLSTYQAIHSGLSQKIDHLFDAQASVARRAVKGGTAIEAVSQQLSEAKKLLAQGSTT